MKKCLNKDDKDDESDDVDAEAKAKREAEAKAKREAEDLEYLAWAEEHIKDFKVKNEIGW